MKKGVYTKMGITHTNLRTTMDCGIIKNMKSFAPIVTLAGLLFCLFSCDAGKSGPFTFTNDTGTEVHVLIDQDGITEKTFTAGEKYQGKDYFTPKITFVKGIDTAENKAIIANAFTISSTNVFDYSFVKADSTAINILVNLQEALPPELTGCYLAEAQGKLGEYSNVTVRLSDIQTPPDPAKTYQLYATNPDFRIYRDKTVDGKTERENLTDLFTIALGKSEIPPAADAPKDAKPTLQWNLILTYPKVEPVE